MASPTDTAAPPELERPSALERLRSGRWAGTGLRTRILLPFVAMLAVATLASVLVAREVLLARLDERIDQELTQEASELRRLAGGVDPVTGEPFGPNARRIFEVYFERNTPSPGEALLTFVDGRPFLRSRLVVPYRLDRDADLVAHWGGLAQPERGRVSTPAGPVQFLALPLRAEGDVRGVFVVAVFRDLQRGPFDDAILATGAVALAILLFGSLLAWRAAESVLRPVRSVTQTAQSITETDLSRRIEVEGDDELAELAATFNAMLGRLETAFSGQRRFLDEIGHELKTPLTIVRGHLELVGSDPAEREETHRLVLDELDRMSRLVNDLLLLAKAEAPDFLRLETVDVARLTEELAAKMQPLAARRWRVEAAGRGMIVADRQRLTQALTQLADNASKHTEEGDEIVFGSSVGADAARFWVRDTGPGVPSAERRRIFEPFERGTAPGAGDGVGLGLSIVRAIAEAHRGRVEVASDGSGSTFTLVVPLDQPEART